MGQQCLDKLFFFFSFYAIYMRIMFIAPLCLSLQPLGDNNNPMRRTLTVVDGVSKDEASKSTQMT